jgi:hypothetical protein
MTTLKDWKEMCIVKKKLDDTMLKINDMFIEISNGCQFNKEYYGICFNENHINFGSVYNTLCELEKCPIVADGVEQLDKKTK